MKAVFTAVLIALITSGCQRLESPPEFSSAEAQLEQRKLETWRKQSRPIPQVRTAAVSHPLPAEKAIQVRSLLAKYERELAIGEAGVWQYRDEAPVLADEVLNVVRQIRISIDRIRAQLDRQEDESLVELEVVHLMRLSDQLTEICKSAR